MNRLDPKPEWYELAIAEEAPRKGLRRRDWLLILGSSLAMWGCIGAAWWWVLEHLL